MIENIQFILDSRADSNIISFKNLLNENNTQTLITYL